MKSWVKILLTVFITCSLTCTILELEKNEDVCHHCGNEVPSKYMYQQDGKAICPNCIYATIEDIISNDTGKCYRCDDLYDKDRSFGLGLCRDCGSSSLTDCVFCGAPTFIWSDDDWYAFCPRCMGYAVENTDIEELLDEMRE